MSRFENAFPAPVYAFVLEQYTEESLREDPDFITAQDARYHLDGIRETDPDVAVPVDLDADDYALIWNHEVKVRKLSDFLTENNAVCLYSNYRLDYPNSDPDVFPVDFLDHQYCDTLGLSILELFEVFRRSQHTFNPNHEYCWYDSTGKTLYSADFPFRDNVIHAEPLARYALEDDSLLSEIRDGWMDKVDRRIILNETA